MPVMLPAMSDLNFTPSSTGLSAPASATPEVAVLAQIVTVEGTVMLRDLLVVCTGVPASFTRAVKANVPVAVGVPAIAPLLEFSVRPGGSAPLAMDQL